MIAVDLDSYFYHTGQPTDEARSGIRLMQWANYVKRRIQGLTVAEEMALLERDSVVMGCSDWWFKC
jgi:hypothetical protein